METSSVSSATTIGTTSRKALISSDFNMFLKLMTTQMKNQDPLNPIDSSDYATQLATFSGVEQQMKSNDLLTALSSQMSVLGMSQLAAWVGQEARAEAPVWMDGDPVTLALSPSSAGDKATLVTRNAKGAVVAREEVPTTSGPYQWLGADASGNPLPEGLYTLTVESSLDGEVVATTPVESYARIMEARNGTGGTTLILEGGVEVSADKIKALRVPG